MIGLDREYLEDYEQKEKALFGKFLKDIHGDKFSFGKDRYPPDARFEKLQKPIAMACFRASYANNIWAQIPFCGSLFFSLPPVPQHLFEQMRFKVSEIPRIIDFIKETGKLQVVLSQHPLAYEGLDYLDPFFKRLNPPVNPTVMPEILGTKKEVKEAENTFYTLGKVRCFDFLKKLSQKSGYGSRIFSLMVNRSLGTYVILKLGHWTHPIVDDIENLMIDDPQKAIYLLGICRMFIADPINDTRCDMRNFALEDIRKAQGLPIAYQPQEIRFPCEIGQFLLKKLTYAPQGLRTCNDLIDHYDAYDLQKVQQSLNEAIVNNHPYLVNKSVGELSEILDNIWNDPTIPRRIKNLKRGLPISMAAIGTAVSAFTGGLEGFLAGLGFSVGSKFLDVEIEEMSERIVKFFARSHQANVYDFKKKYESKIAHP